VQEAINLRVNCRRNGWIAMSHIEAPDAAGKIDEDVAVDIFEERAVAVRNVNRGCMVHAARNGLQSPQMKLLRARARYGRL
jgi:hypothetical protein